MTQDRERELLEHNTALVERARAAEARADALLIGILAMAKTMETMAAELRRGIEEQRRA